MALVYRADLARNLTATEVDGNFRELDERVDDLEDSRPQPDNIASVATAGTQLTFYLQSGTSIGTVTLPTLAWRARGEWLPFTIYAALDVFSVAGEGLFLTLIDHTSAATFDAEATTGSPATAIYQQLIGIGTNAVLDDISDVDVTGAGANAMLVAVATGSPAVITWEDRTPAQVTALLNTFSGDAGAGGAKGIVLAPAAGDAAANKFLHASGGWEVLHAADATLVAGTVTVANTTVTANTKVLLSRKTIGGTTGDLSYTVSAGVGFTINSSSATDTSTVSYMLAEDA